MLSVEWYVVWHSQKIIGYRVAANTLHTNIGGNFMNNPLKYLTYLIVQIERYAKTENKSVSDR